MKKDRLTLATIIQSPELRKRVLFTIGILALFRLGVHIPIPGIPTDLLTSNPFLSRNFVDMYDLFAGGALATLSIFALGIGPFISASIIMQIATRILPQLKELREEGATGQRKIRQLMRWLTLGIAAFDSTSLTITMAAMNGSVASLHQPLMMAFVAIVLTASAMLVMWLAESITENGIGNGSSLLLCVGIAARLPLMINQTRISFQSGQTPAWGIALMIIVFIMLAVISVTIQEAVRKVAVKGGKPVRGQSSNRADHLYLSINPAGVMPIAFASQFILFLGMILSGALSCAARVHQLLLSNRAFGTTWSLLANNASVQTVFQAACAEVQNFQTYKCWESYVLYGFLIGCFALFYASIMLPSNEIAEDLRRNHRVIEGIRPGRRTKEFIGKTVNRLSLIGAAALMLIALLPIEAAQLAQIQTLFGFGSTSVVILTGVAMDTKRRANVHALGARYQKQSLFGDKEKKC